MIKNKFSILKNTFNLLDNYNNDSIDDYYMMVNPAWLSSNYVKILRKTSDKNNNASYRMGVSGDSIKEILESYNKSIRLDKEGTKWIDVYDIENSFEARKSEIEYVIDSTGKLSTIDMEFKGFYKIDTGKQVKFEFDLEIEFDYSKKAYTAPTDKKDIQLPNY